MQELQQRVSTEGLATEVKRAADGQRPDSVLLLVQAARLPMAYITSPSGVVQTKVISYPDLLAALDDSSVVAALNGEEHRSTSLPPLPANALLVDLHESPAGNAYTVTGYIEPQTYLFCLETRDKGEVTTSTYEIPLPYLVYSVHYDHTKQAVDGFSLTLCALGQTPESDRQRSSEGDDQGETENSAAAGLAKDEGPQRAPDSTTQLYKYPFSNVYDVYGQALEGVCWPTMGSIETSLADVPATIVRAFLELPNTNQDLFGRGLSHNAPYSRYDALLEHIERDGLAQEYLIPTGATVQGLHDQVRDIQQGA